MPVAYYMKFRQGQGPGDRLGGVPTHLPPTFPRCSYDGKQLAFLAQFYCASPRLELPDTLCIQIYQDIDVGEGGDPRPIVVRVPFGAPKNEKGLGLPQIGIISHDIDYDERLDPENAPEFPEDLPLYDSKIGGLCLFDVVEEPEAYLLQLREDPGEFNFGTYNCVISISPDGRLTASLG